MSTDPRHLVLVGYDAEHTARALAVCDVIGRGLGLEHRLLVANSAAVEVTAPTGWQVLSGSNRMGEFSGWQEGLARLGSSGAAAALLVNDTIGSQRHPSVFRRWALRQEIEGGRGADWVGFVDRGVEPIGRLTIGAADCGEWVSTYCFYLPRLTLACLDGRLYEEAALERSVPGGPDRATFFSEHVSPELRRLLSAWLFDGGWRRSAPLDEQNAAAMTFKARCICAELLLSSRLRSLGVPLREPMRRHRLAAWLDRLNERLRTRNKTARSAPATA